MFLRIGLIPPVKDTLEPPNVFKDSPELRFPWSPLALISCFGRIILLGIPPATCAPTLT